MIGNTKLKGLELNGNKGITNASIPYLIEIAKKSCITEIDLYWTTITEVKQQELAEFLEIPIKSNSKSAAKISPEMLNTISKLINDGGKSSLNRAKIMTGGKGRASKAATIRSLTGQSFNPLLESTIGADAKNDCEVDIKYADNEWGLLNDEQKKEIASQHQARAMKIMKTKEEEERQQEKEMMMKRRMEMDIDVLLFWPIDNSQGPDSEDMKNMIVLNPQWLVDAITKVIRHFDMHDYKDDIEMKKEIKNKYFNEFKRLKDELIASVELMYLLWRDEDNRSNGDFTRRRYLLSLMENMNLLTPWMFDEDVDNNNGMSNVSASSSSSISMNTDRLPTHYLIPSNLRLLGEEITNKKMMEINKVIPFIDIDNINNANNESNGLDCIVIDISDSILPVGLYDRLICKLVSHSLKHYQDNRKPIIGNGSILMSIGNRDFRVDEYQNKSKIIVTINNKCKEKYVILDMIEKMIDEVNRQIMNTSLKYKICIVALDSMCDEICMIDIGKVREAMKNKSNDVRALNDRLVLLSDIIDTWIPPKNNSMVELIRIPLALKMKSNRCEILERIGDGGFSNVYKLKMRNRESNDDDLLAFKQFNVSANAVNSNEIAMVEREIDILGHLEHPNIVKIIGAIGDPDAIDINNKPMGIGIVMDYCENGSLRSLLNKNGNHQLLNMDLIIHLLFGIAQGLEYLHNH